MKSLRSAMEKLEEPSERAVHLYFQSIFGNIFNKIYLLETSYLPNRTQIFTIYSILKVPAHF